MHNWYFWHKPAELHVVLSMPDFPKLHQLPLDPYQTNKLIDQLCEWYLDWLVNFMIDAQMKGPLPSCLSPLNTYMRQCSVECLASGGS
jgi:hypothetical protein